MTDSRWIWYLDLWDEGVNCIYLELIVSIKHLYKFPQKLKMYTYCIFLHVVCGWKECCHLLWTEKLLHKKNVFKYWRKCFYTILFLSQSRWLLQLNQFVDYSVSCDQQHPRLDKSQNFMTLISSALQGFFSAKSSRNAIKYPQSFVMC